MHGNRWMAFAVGAGLMIGAAGPSPAQFPPPPAPGPIPGQDLERLSKRMAEAMRRLAEEIAPHAGQIPNGGLLARDVQELERATGEWYASLRGPTDHYQVHRSYSAIDAGWHRLRSQLGPPKAMPPGLSNEVTRVEKVDAQIHQTLQLNSYPPNFQGDSPTSNPQDELIRLSYTLAQRGEELAAAIQAEYGGHPASPPLNALATEVAQRSDAFYDALTNQGAATPPNFVRDSYVPIIQKSNELGVALGAANMSPRMNATWMAYTTVFNMVRAKVGLSDRTPDGRLIQDPNNPAFDTRGIPFVVPQPESIARYAEELDRQVDELVHDFAPTAGVAPQGREMLEEMNRLRDDVHHFRQRVAEGSDPNRLAYEFRAVDADANRLSRHFARVARGRTGPNNQRVQQIAQTCEQIHRALGMPGFPPTFGPY